MTTSGIYRLRPRWRDFVGRAGGNVAITTESITVIEKLYSEPGRHYHTLHHVGWCLDLLDEFLAPLDASPREGRPPWFERVELALWFHDIIYDPKRKDNEAQSARVLKGYAALHGIDNQLAELAAVDVIATTHAGFFTPTDEATAWVLDLDLASLGFPPESFDLNSQQIRQEYAWVPEDAYRAGRTKILQQFLDRPRLYLTDPCHERFEAQARENLERAIEKLR